MVYIGTLFQGTTGSTEGKVSRAETLRAKARVGIERARAATRDLAGAMFPFRSLETAAHDGRAIVAFLRDHVDALSAGVSDLGSTLDEYLQNLTVVDRNAADVRARVAEWQAAAAEYERAGDREQARAHLQAAADANQMLIDYLKIWSQTGREILTWPPAIDAQLAAVVAAQSRLAVFMNTWRSVSNEHFAQEAAALMQDLANINAAQNEVLHQLNETNTKQTNLINRLNHRGAGTGINSLLPTGLALLALIAVASSRRR